MTQPTSSSILAIRPSWNWRSREDLRIADRLWVHDRCATGRVEQGNRPWRHLITCSKPLVTGRIAAPVERPLDRRTLSGLPDRRAWFEALNYGNFLQGSGRAGMIVLRMAERADVFVPVIVVIHLHTSLGTFLDVGDRRIFVPQFYTSTLLRRYAPGEKIAVQLLRSFAEQERLIA
jgi:hypothetical protein